MKKDVIIFVAVAVLVVGLAFVVSNLSNKSYIKEITYEEYEKLTKEGKNYIYVGDLTNVNTSLNALGEGINKKNKDEYVYHLNINTLTDEQLKKVYNKDTLYYYEEGELASKNEISLTDVDVTKYIKTIKSKGYHFMFIGSSSCGYCTKFKEEIRKSQVLYDFDVYYLDLYSVGEDDANKLYETDEYFTTQEWGTPLNFLYKDGKRVDVLNGYVSAEELIQFLKNNGAI